MAQELLIRELEVPQVFEAPPWADQARRRSAEETEQPEQSGQERDRHGTA
jgi:hypothetical protein